MPAEKNGAEGEILAAEEVEQETRGGELGVETGKLAVKEAVRAEGIK